MPVTKPGWQTSEFWLSLIVAVFAVVVVIHPGFKAPPGLAEALAPIAAAIAVWGYSFSRGVVKATAASTAVAPPAPTAKDVAAALVTTGLVAPPAAPTAGTLHA